MNCGCGPNQGWGWPYYPAYQMCLPNNPGAYIDAGVTSQYVYSSIYPSVTFSDVLYATADVSPCSAEIDRAAVAGYVRNNSAITNGVALRGVAMACQNNSKVWGVNTLLQDSNLRGAITGTNRVLIGAELDFNIMCAGTEVIGVSVGGNSLAQPANASGFIVNNLGNGNKWTGGFVTEDGVTDNGLSLGMISVTAAPDTFSQKLGFSIADHAGVKQEVLLQATGISGTAGSYLRVEATEGPVNLFVDGGNVELVSGARLVVNNRGVVSDQKTGWSPSAGTPVRSGFDADYTQVWGASYSQTEMQSLQAWLTQLSRLVVALQTDLTLHGLIGP